MKERPVSCDVDKKTAGATMNEEYFKLLLDETRAMVLSCRLDDREEILARFGTYSEAFHRMNGTRGYFNKAEKHKMPPEEIEKARVEAEAAAEEEGRLNKETTSYLETSVFPRLNLQDESQEVIEAMMKCAIIHQATPKGLALFCSESEDQARSVQHLLDSSPQIMKEMLLNGGASGGNYGRAYAIYRQCLDLVEDVNDPVYGPCHKRLAMAVALEHATMIEGFDTKDVYIDPLERFVHYIEAHMAGELDPAFSYFSTWEYRHVVNCNATNDQLKWARDHLRRYRPDQVTMADMTWRYAVAVRSDVGYRKPNWTSRPKTYQQLVSGGGRCGPRAWYGRYMCKAHGIPTWGVKQPAHAALSRWTPTADGWVTQLGGGWHISNWDNRTGTFFLADAHSRSLFYNKEEALFGKVTLLECMSAANNEDGSPKAEETRYDPTRLWGSLVTAQRAVLAQKVAQGHFYRGPAKGEGPNGFVSDIENYINRKDNPRDDNKITLSAGDGSINIPACAFSKQGNSIPMKSFEGGAQVLMEKGESFLEFTMPGK